MHIEQSEKFVGDDWWDWSVWIEGSAEELDGIRMVEWRLHPTFPNPVRRIADRRTKFRLETGGWGVFPIHATVFLNSGDTKRLRHQLELHYPDGSPNTA